MIEASRWQKIQDLFDRALEEPEAVRQAWLLEACADDTDLLKEVRSLLKAEKTVGSIRDQVFDAVRAAIGSFEQEEFPRIVGSYRLLRQIGRGGMGTVYLAERADGHFEKQVAVKMVRAGMDTEFILARFRRERQVLARFEHPNIGRLLDAGTASHGVPYFAMEYIDGDWITRHCDAKHLGVKERLRLFLSVCSAVHYAHLHFVVHRDLKPGNILVDSGGNPKLLDFGVCKLLYREGEPDPGQTGSVGMRLLTPEYASPEQVRGGQVTIASDVYSLGAVLYELLTGAPPHVFPTLTPQAVEQVVCEEEVVAPSQASRRNNGKLASQLRGDIDNILLRAMHKEPTRRYETVEQFAADIQKHLSDDPVSARPDSFLYRSHKFLRRNRAKTWVAVAVFVAFSAGLFATHMRGRLFPPILSGTHRVIPPKDRIQMLVELGDDYSQEGNWKDASVAYAEAQEQLMRTNDLDAKTWGNRIKAGMELAQKHQQF